MRQGKTKKDNEVGHTPLTKVLVSAYPICRGYDFQHPSILSSFLSQRGNVMRRWADEKQHVTARLLPRPLLFIVGGQVSIPVSVLAHFLSQHKAVVRR